MASMTFAEVDAAFPGVFTADVLDECERQRTIRPGGRAEDGEKFYDADDVAALAAEWAVPVGATAPALGQQRGVLSEFPILRGVRRVQDRVRIADLENARLLREARKAWEAEAKPYWEQGQPAPTPYPTWPLTA